jgi:phosphatidylglycerol---prolipoprotein diacylglyceryl transferase
MAISTAPLAALVSVLALIAVSPDPIAFQLGSIPVYWYGVCYAVGLAATYTVITREARRRGLDATLVDNGIIIVAAAALIGGRLYHVIDQWQLYRDDPLSIILPPYTGLGVYGGILLGTIVAAIIIRRWKQSFWRWADVIAPGIFVMQAIGRWGNFFNQELYGPSTDLPWGISIDCAHRVPVYPCTTYPEATTGFHPLFLYESLSGALGAVTLLWIARRYGRHMRPGDLWLMFLIWYSAVRLVLETLRTGNWTFFGVPVAMLVAGAVIVAAVAALAWRHRASAMAGDRWNDPVPVGDDDDEWVDVDEDDDDGEALEAPDEGTDDTDDDAGPHAEDGHDDDGGGEGDVDAGPDADGRAGPGGRPLG